MAKKKPRKSTGDGFWADELDGVHPLDKPKKPPTMITTNLGELLKANDAKREAKSKQEGRG